MKLKKKAYCLNGFCEIGLFQSRESLYRKGMGNETRRTDGGVTIKRTGMGKGHKLQLMERGGVER